MNDSVVIDNDKQPRSHNNPMTLLTTSLSGVQLSDETKYLIAYLNYIIPNSIIQTRLFISEANLIKIAVIEGYNNIIIVLMQSGNPVGLCFLDLIQQVKLNIKLSSYVFDKHCSKVENPKLFIENYKKLNKSQECIIHFLLSNIPKSNDDPDANTIILKCCNHKVIKFKHHSAGFKFNMEF